MIKDKKLTKNKKISVVQNFRVQKFKQKKVVNKIFWWKIKRLKENNVCTEQKKLKTLEIKN